MASTSDPPRTKKFALKVNSLCCEACQKEMEKKLREIGRIDLVKMDQDKDQITICGTVDPKVAIYKLNKHFKKDAKLVKMLEDKKPVVKTDQPRPSSRDKETIRNIAKPTKGEPSPTTKVATTCHHVRQHQHMFELKDYYKPFWCDGCREIGTGKRHKCKHCTYELHNKCHSAKRTTTHVCFPDQTFSFLKQRPGKHPGQCCSACGKAIYGFVYKAKAKAPNGKSLYLHPLCSDTKRKVTIEETDFILCSKAQSNCVWCKKDDAPGWAYSSKGGQYSYHVYCLSKMVVQAWKEGQFDEGKIKALENVDPKAVVEKKEKYGQKILGGGRYWIKVLYPFLRFALGILLGDPTAIGPLILAIFNN